MNHDVSSSRGKNSDMEESSDSLSMTASSAKDFVGTQYIESIVEVGEFLFFFFEFLSKNSKIDN